MTIKDNAYVYFLTALNDILKNQQSAVELSLNAMVSEAYISQIKNEKRQAGFMGQIKIANACGYEYFDFLQLGKSLVDGSQKIKTSQKDRFENLQSKAKPQIGNVIRVYNNVLEKTGIELDEEGQEKLFNLIKERLQEKAVEAAEKDLLDIISITSLRKKG